jgi:hypothetical protein
MNIIGYASNHLHVLWRIYSIQELLSHRNFETHTQRQNYGLDQSASAVTSHTQRVTSARMGDGVFRGVRAKELFKNKRRYGSFLSSVFSVDDSHGKFVDLWRLNVWLEDFIYVQYLEGVIQCDCYNSCVLAVVPAEDQCVWKSTIALYWP